MRQESEKGIERLAKVALERFRQKKEYHILSQYVREDLLRAEVLVIAYSWMEADEIPVTTVQRLWTKTYQLWKETE